MTEQGFKAFSFWHYGMKQFSADHSIRIPKDVIGLKYRSYSNEIAKTAFEEVGASPQEIPFKEVYTAMQQG
jgi:C4-dicarboxylate-binding protein DctP